MSGDTPPYPSLRYGLWRVAEYFFTCGSAASTPPGVRADLVDFVQLAEPLPYGTWSVFPTLVVDLGTDDDSILGAMNATTRNEVRRAGREENRHVVHSSPDRATCARFAAAYAPLRKERSLSSAIPRRLTRLAAAGHLQLSEMCDRSGTVSWHSYLVAAATARLYHSVTLRRDGATAPERARASRAHRLHHFLDMVHFRDQGYQHYDFGGWYDGDEDARRVAINRFKEGFGGARVLTYNGVAPLTPWGEVFVRLRAMRGGA